MLDGTSWSMHDAYMRLSKWSFGGPGLAGLPLGRDALRSTDATKLSSRRRLSFFFYFLKWEDVPSLGSATYFPLP
jgi:hypothetical protein